MFEFIRSREFLSWFEAMRDQAAQRRVAERLARVQLGNFGDAKPVGDGVSELRVHHGPGYRVYFARRGARLILLLIGGDKQSQSRDIEKAKAILRAFGEQDD